MSLKEQYDEICKVVALVEAEEASDFKDQKLDYLYNVKKIIEVQADNAGITL